MILRLALGHRLGTRQRGSAQSLSATEKLERWILVARPQSLPRRDELITSSRCLATQRAVSRRPLAPSLPPQAREGDVESSRTFSTAPRRTM